MKKRYSIIMFVVMMFVFVLLPVQIFAASKTVTVLDGKVSITDSSGKGSGTAEKYTATVKGGLFSKKSNTITIANETKTKAQIKFDYTVESASSFTIEGIEATANGSYSATLEPNAQIAIVLTSNSGTSNLTATLMLTSIAYTEVSDSSEMKIVYENSLGSVTAGVEAIESGSSITVEGDGVELVATPSSGNVFVAWTEENGKILSKDAAYKLEAIGNKTIKAIFSNNTPYFIVDDVMYDTWGDAMEDAEAKATSKPTTVMLACDGTLPEGEYVIPSGVTLLIPFDEQGTLYKEEPGKDNGSYSKPKVYRKLNLANGVKIIVNGAISVSAKQSSKINYNGAPVGAYGQIAMAKGSTITVNNGANLYAWGFITGSGNVIAKLGATVYEDFQVRDWRGGDVTSAMIDNAQRVFPMSQYYVQNIEVPLTLEYGAIEKGYMSITVTLAGIQASHVPFIGDGGMFSIKSGSVTKDYDEKNDRLIIDVNGELDMSPLSISMKLNMWGYKAIDSSKYTLPVNSNITLNAKRSSKVNITQDIALLPGAVIKIEEDAFCTLAPDSKIFLYGRNDWGGYCSASNVKYMTVAYAPGRKYTRTEADLIDAEVSIKGTINSLDGSVFTTVSGANIYGEEGGSVMIRPNEKIAYTYQVMQKSENGNQSVDRYIEIPVVPAKLKNADGQYAEMLGDCCTAYKYVDGKWIPDEGVEGAIYHTSIVTVDGVEPTCTEDGYSESSYCSACNTVIKAQETIPSTGHKFSTEWTTDIEPTHKDAGEKSHHCLNCSEKADVTIIDALGHSFGNWTKVDGVTHKGECDCGETEIDAHNFVGLNCSKCGCEKLVTNTIYNIKEGNLEIDSSLILEVSPDTQIIIATYDAYGKLLKASAFAAELLEKVILPADEVAKIKVFAWNGFGGVVPVSGVEELTLGGE